MKALSSDRWPLLHASALQDIDFFPGNDSGSTIDFEIDCEMTAKLRNEIKGQVGNFLAQEVSSPKGSETVGMP